MTTKIEELIKKATVNVPLYYGPAGFAKTTKFDKEKFAELIIKETLDQVNERAYYSGDRAWSDDLDRKWVELHFGLGSLAK